MLGTSSVAKRLLASKESVGSSPHGEEVHARKWKLYAATQDSPLDGKEHNKSTKQSASDKRAHGNASEYDFQHETNLLVIQLFSSGDERLGTGALPETFPAKLQPMVAAYYVTSFH
jgi:hypothetical protein